MAAIKDRPHARETVAPRNFAARAVATLREALAGGHENPDMIASDVDFDAIKSNEDFKALLTELRARR